MWKQSWHSTIVVLRTIGTTELTFCFFCCQGATFDTTVLELYEDVHEGFYHYRVLSAGHFGLLVPEMRGVRVAGNDRNFYYAFWLP